MEVTGKIDRIDVAKIEDKQYVRIIDYKSSVKDIDLNDVYAGIQIQLLTYLNAVNKAEDTLSAGVLYFNLIEPVIKSNRNLTDEQLENQIRKSFKMNGLILADIKIVKSMDKTLLTGYSSIVPAYIGADGNLNQKLSKAITAEEFNKLQEDIENLLKQISKEILSGNISIKPYYKNKKTPCQYCPYLSICNFNSNMSNNDYNYIKNIVNQQN